MAYGRERVEIDIVAIDRASATFRQVAGAVTTFGASQQKVFANAAQSLSTYNRYMARTNMITIGGLYKLRNTVRDFTKDSIKAYATLEHQHAKTMGALASKYDKTAESQARLIKGGKELQQQAIDLALSGPTGTGSLYSSGEIAGIQTALAKAGMKESKDIISATPMVMKFSGGNDLDVEKGAEYAINLSKMWDIPIESLGDALDKVTKAADMSTIGVKDLMLSMKYAGPIANAIDRSFEETLAVIAELGNKGIKGSMAGTGIQAILTKMMSPIGKSEESLSSAPSARSRDLFVAYSRDIMDEEGNLKPLQEVVDMFDDVTSTLNDQETAWFAHKMIGLRQMKALLSLSDVDIAGTADELKDASGAVDAKWAIMMESSYGRSEALKQAKQALKTDFGKRIAPATVALMDELFNWIKDPQNYNIDYQSIQTGLKKSSANVAEKYGEALGDATEDLGRLQSKTVIGGISNVPMLTGVLAGVGKLLEGDFWGAVESITEGFDATTENIEKLPPELQDMATGIRNVITMFTGLAALNISTTIAEFIMRALTMVSAVANMSVAAANVTIVGGATLGTPVGGGPAVVGGHRTFDVPGAGTIVSATGTAAVGGAGGTMATTMASLVKGAFSIPALVTYATLYGLNSVQMKNKEGYMGSGSPQRAYDVRGKVMGSGSQLDIWNAGMSGEDINLRDYLNNTQQEGFTPNPGGNSMFQMQELIDKINQKPPVVNIDVNVDKSGNVDVSYLGGSAVNWRQMESRLGKGSEIK